MKRAGIGVSRHDETRVYAANFGKSGNDLFWELVTLDPQSDHIHHVRWEGYADGFWWNNVAPRARARLRRCACGQWFCIDFRSGEARAVSEEDARAAMAVDAVLSGEFDGKPVKDIRRMIEQMFAQEGR